MSIKSSRIRVHMPVLQAFHRIRCTQLITLTVFFLGKAAICIVKQIDIHFTLYISNRFESKIHHRTAYTGGTIFKELGYGICIHTIPAKWIFNLQRAFEYFHSPGYHFTWKYNSSKVGRYPHIISQQTNLQLFPTTVFQAKKVPESSFSFNFSVPAFPVT